MCVTNWTNNFTSEMGEGREKITKSAHIRPTDIHTRMKFSLMNVNIDGKPYLI